MRRSAVSTSQAQVLSTSQAQADTALNEYFMRSNAVCLSWRTHLLAAMASAAMCRGQRASALRCSCHMLNAQPRQASPQAHPTGLTKRDTRLTRARVC